MPTKLELPKTGERPTLLPNPNTVIAGNQIVFKISPPLNDPCYGTSPIITSWNIVFGNNTYDDTFVTPDINDPSKSSFVWDTTGVPSGHYMATVTVQDADDLNIKHRPSAMAMVAPRPLMSGDVLPVTLKRTADDATSDSALWVVIRNSTNALSFQSYTSFIDSVMCCPGSLDTQCSPGKTTDACAVQPPLSQRRALPFPDMDAYRVLKVATECFLMMNCGVYVNPAQLQKLLTGPGSAYDLNEDATRLNQSPAGLPDLIMNWWKVYMASGNQYLNLPEDAKLKDLTIPYLALVRSRLADLAPRENYEMGIQCYGILKRKLVNPCMIELIWSYWQEECMLVQTLNAVTRRFQNLRSPGVNDALARFDIDPLRGLSNLLWGYVQDEQHRLTVLRRAYEYSHHYGLTLEGKAVPRLRPSDSRSKFLEAFHNLLYLAAIFFKEDDDTTVVADGFPLLNALKEVHYVLAAGASNQFGDLPSTARQEMLMQQWLLARPEMREFLGGKIMVPYPEEWMDRVDSMKTMMGWSDVSSVHFRDLAVYGEQLVLSIRYGAWSITNNPMQAANWARYFRPEVQAYIHRYRAVTGADLTTEPVNATLPSVLLLRRLAAQRSVTR